MGQWRQFFVSLLASPRRFAAATVLALFGAVTVWPELGTALLIRAQMAVEALFAAVFPLAIMVVALGMILKGFMPGKK